MIEVLHQFQPLQPDGPHADMLQPSHYRAPHLVNIAYGSAYIDDGAATVNTTTLHVAVPVTSGLVSADCNGFTFQNASELLCDIPGIYHATWSMSIASNGSDRTIEGKLMVNAVSADQTGNATRAKENGVVYSVGGSGILTLAAGDIVRLAVESETAATTTITINHATITLVQIG